MSHRALVGLLLAFTLQAAGILAQGVIAGTVADGRGRPLPGVTVLIMENAPGTEARRIVTDASGRFVIANLDPAVGYTLTFTLAGFVPQSRTVPATAGSPSVDVTLNVAPLAETFSLQAPLDMPGPPVMPAVPGRPCRHDTNETTAEAERRVEALRAMRVIAFVVTSTMSGARQTAFPSWPALASSPAVTALRNRSGEAAELARKIEWGSREPLPGWGIAYAASTTDVRFALTDLRDECGFTYTSTDARVVPQVGRVLPLES